MVSRDMGYEKTYLRGLWTKKAQTSLRIPSVWSAPLIIGLLESIIYKLAASEISILLLVSIAEETGLSLTYLGNILYSCQSNVQLSG